MLPRDSIDTPAQSGQSVIATNTAEFDRSDRIISSSVEQGARGRNFEYTSGILIVFVGILGMIGHAYNNHLLLSFLPWRSEEIALSSTIALVFLGIAIAQGIPLRNERWKRSNDFLLAGVLCIAGYNLFQYFLAAGFQIFLPLTQDFPEISMSFLTAVQLLGISIGLLLYNRYSQVWGVAVGFSIIVFWLLETVLFSLLGYAANLPVLHSYAQALPAVTAIFIAGITSLKALIRPEGLLSPLRSPIRRIKFFTLASVMTGILVLVAGVAIIALLDRLFIHGVSTQASDQLFVIFELATVGLSTLILLLSLRVLFFYESSLRSQTQVQQLNEQLEQRVEERTRQRDKVIRQKSKVLSMVSHDLKTPLAAVGRFAEILGKDDRLTLEQKEMVGYIVESIQQMRAMVTDILDRAWIEAGKVHARPVEIEVKPFMSKLMPTVQTLAEERMLDVQVEIQPGLRLIADPALLRQILLNLLSNAVKYNKRQGSIRLRAYEDKKARHVVIVVQDTGMGIPADKVPLLFTEFYRIGAGLNTVEGTGLGLASTKKLIELQGGQIEINSVENEGSTFKVLFPKVASDFTHQEQIGDAT
jgi:signal transduction histidine kinase